MSTIEEIPRRQTGRAAAALPVLRPRWKTPAELTDFVDTRLRQAGYRLVGSLEQGRVVAVIGFREVQTTAWGHCLYVDDLSTLPEDRGHGHAGALLDWVFDEARRLGCEGPVKLSV